MEELAELMELYLAEKECEVDVVDDDRIEIYIDLPSTDNYNYFIAKIEKIFRKVPFDVEDYEIDGDYEGQIAIVYIGE
jgi:hypothetical protein